MEISQGYLQDINETTDWNGKSMVVGTYYSAPIKIRRSQGDGALLVKTSAGKIVATMEVSDDAKDWYTPYDRTMSSIGEINNNLTANTWIQFDIPVAKYIRFKFVVSVATSTVSAFFKYRSVKQ